MSNSFKDAIRREIKSLVELKKTERLWHIPVLASLCIGIPLLIASYFGKPGYGILAGTGGLVILYLPSTTVAHRMVYLLSCSFGFMISFTIGISFSFNPIVSSVVLGLFSFGIHWISNFFEMRPPGNFFFIMLASIASCLPFDLPSIPERVGVIGMGTMLACLLAFFYSLYITKKHSPKTKLIGLKKNRYVNLFESTIIGFFIGFSLLIANLFKLQNPYWIPISCAAVMQGVSVTHVWQRSFHRIAGTFIGLGLAWLLLQLHMTPLNIFLSIMVLQFIVEMLVVRHYGLAVIFITPLTIFLAEAGNALITDPNTLIPARFLDILYGSLIGALGGFFLHHQQIRHKVERQIRKTRVAILRR